MAGDGSEGLIMTDRGLMKRYLLGMASDGERDGLEDEYLSRQEVFEELTEAENDLLDSYTRGRLSDSERQEFEKRYLTSAASRTRVEFSRALSALAAEGQSPSAEKISFRQTFLAFLEHLTLGPQLGIAAACAVVLIVAVLSWRSSRNENLRAHSAPLPGGHRIEAQPPYALNSVPPRSSPRSDPEEPEIARQEMLPLGEFTLQLEPGVSRAVGSSTTFFASVGVSWLNLQLTVDDENHSSYVAELETADGAQIRRVEGLSRRLVSGRRVVILRLPAKLIPTGDYVVELKTLGEDQKTEESIDSYSFRVVSK